MKAYVVVGTFYLYDSYSSPPEVVGQEEEVLKVFENKSDAEVYCNKQRTADRAHIQVVDFVKKK